VPLPMGAWARSERHPDWMKFCRAMKDDTSVDASLEATAASAEDARNENFGEETVDVVSRCGFKMETHFRMHKDADIRDVARAPADVDLKDLSLAASAMEMPGGASCSGITTASPDKPHVDISRVEEYLIEGRVRAQSAERHVYREQAKKVVKAEAANVKSAMPTVIRGRNLAPPIDSIRFEAALKTNAGAATRDQQLETQVNLGAILDGSTLGDRECALRRFKPALIDAQNRKQELLHLIEKATELSVTSLHIIKDPQVSSRHLRALIKGGVGVTDCPKWCLAWLRAGLQRDTDAEAPVEDIPSQARDDLLNYLILPMVKEGESALTQIKELRKILAALLCAVILGTLGDHSLDSVACIGVDLTNFRKMLHGEVDRERASFSREMDDAEFWRANKNQWRRAAQVDMKGAPLMKARLAEIGQHHISSTIRATSDDLHRWFVACRSGTAISIVMAVVEAATGTADKYTTATGTERGSLVGELLETQAGLTRFDQLFANKSSPKRVRELFEDGLATLLDAIREMAEKAPQTAACNSILKVPKDFVGNTDKGNAASEIRVALLSNSKVKFSTAEHYDDIFKAFGAAANHDFLKYRPGSDDDLKTARMINFGGDVEFLRELCKLAALDAHGVLSRMGGAAQQVTNDDGPNYYNHLVKAISTTNARAAASAKLGANKRGVTPQMALDQYRDADVEQAHTELQNHCANLAKLAFFNEEEVCWKRGLSGDSPLEDARGQARASIFSAKGLAAKTRKAIGDIERAKKNLTDTAVSHKKDLLPTQHATIDNAMKTQPLAHKARLEAGALQILFDEKQTMAGKTTAVTSLLDLLPQARVSIRDFHVAAQKSFNELPQ
ncbi:unnamed protein product, partial [Prorocentrum cordatum]